MTPPVASAGMLIRRPVAEVFAALADPAITARFWFTEATGPLAEGASVRWTWGMYGASAEVAVTAFEPDRRILMDWGVPGAMTTVEWTFAAHPMGTMVEVTDSGFTGSQDEQVERALDSTGGFALVLSAAKIWLEHGIDPRIISDRFPTAWSKDWDPA